ncbi:LysR family transcriptional regulator [Oceanobacter sp. 3_MG-2023]|uniref:LysR family transcriptional regulator n=1 Tax=Oceanobacter sp. 3_MG-2023 TaxID=3062622 RepID=UPI002735032C|nr:LysR family transcriptional regulator [Oceanobacter sp. 3_MG-2023]MDP2505817.1 LysR family transcriptional regulator [Oceanobacter sp. 3_MG-2023]
MNPNLLKQLAMVVKQGSISAAAEQLFITQPTLSRALQQLEMRVGAPVLTRTRYGMVPTDIGARLAHLGERILADTEQGDEIIRQWHSGYDNQFTIGIDPLWEYATVAEMTSGFLSQSRYVFHCRVGSAATQIEWLQNGELDFLLAPAHLSVAHACDRQEALQRQVVFRDRSGVFVGKQSPLLGSQQPVSLDMVAQQRWLIAGASAGFLSGVEDPAAQQAARIAFTGGIRSVIHLLNTTDMLVRLPARLALMTGEIAPQQLIQIEDQTSARRDIALWSRQQDSERPDSQKVRSFIRDWVTGLDQTVGEFGLAL